MNHCNLCRAPVPAALATFAGYPLGNAYLDVREAAGRYFRTLSIHGCEACGHILGISAFQPEELYTAEYGYIAESSGVRFRREMIVSHVRRHGADTGMFGRVIDVGCNQLGMLKLLRESGIAARRWIGIDPVGLKPGTDPSGITFVQGNLEDAVLPEGDRELPDLVICDQVLEHVVDLTSFVGKLAGNLAMNSLLIVCVPSVELMIETLTFHDLIHEHVNYFSQRSLHAAFRGHGLRLAWSGLNNEGPRGYLFQVYERSSRPDDMTLPWKGSVPIRFRNQFSLYRDALSVSRRLLEAIDRPIYGLGASELTPTLAYHMQSDFSFLASILDTTAAKARKFMPGISPPIEPYDDGRVENSVVFITAPQLASKMLPALLAKKPYQVVNPLPVI